MIASSDAVFDQFAHAGAGPHHIRGDPVEFAETFVANDEISLRIKHAETVRHITQGGVEAEVLLRQRVSQIGLFPRRQQ